METPKIFESEYRFCLILWEHEPIKSRELVELCREKLGWNKSTTYTVLRKLKHKGAVRHEDATVTPVLTRQAAIQAQTQILADLGAKETQAMLDLSALLG